MALAFLNGTFTSHKAADDSVLRALIDRSITEIEIPEGVETIGAYTFDSCRALVSVKIPESVTAIKNYAFHDCVALTEIVIPDSVTEIKGSVFHGCAGLISVKLPANLTALDANLFYQCSSLPYIKIPPKINIIFGGALRCSNCLVFDFSELEQVPGMSHSNAFLDISAEAKILVPAALYDEWVVATNWSVYADHIVAKAEGSEGLAYELNFNGDKYNVVGMGSCTDSDLIIPSTYNGLPVGMIDMSAFYNCVEIERVTIPDGVYISWSAFQDCIGLKEVIFKGESITIGGSVFCGCLALESIKLPSGMGAIGWSLFAGCDSLKLIDFTSFTQVPELAYDDAFPRHEGLIIKVPASLYDEWVNATNWTLYADYIVAV